MSKRAQLPGMGRILHTEPIPGEPIQRWQVLKIWEIVNERGIDEYLFQWILSHRYGCPKAGFLTRELADDFITQLRDAYVPIRYSTSWIGKRPH